jgi:hypothetical protein
VSGGFVHHHVCSVQSSREPDTRRADARLIAAAPDLLAALRMVVACADNGAWDARPGASSDRAARAVAAARAAIARATGQEGQS